jgi:sugar lactone lactonase YvrE
MKYLAECICDCRNTLGEAPVWQEVESRIYWIDVSAPSLNWIDTSTGKHTSRVLPKLVGSIVPRASGGLLIVFRSALALLNDADAPIELVQPELQLGEERMNDAKCDAAGRVWIGTLDRRLREGQASLCRIESALRGQRMDGPFTVGNGPAWSPDSKKMYFTDTRAKTIYVYDFDVAEGAVEHRRVFARIADSEKGQPDGCAVDADGCLWSAIIGAGKISRFDPDGKLVEDIALPIPDPTSCCFGGPGFSTLYVTTARRDVEDRSKDGSLFAIETDVTGMRVPSFLG